jgi:hypothetical protein
MYLGCGLPPGPPPTVAIHRADRRQPLPVAACIGAMWLYVRATLVLLPPVCIATGVALGFVVVGSYHCHVPARSPAWSLAGHNARTRGVAKGTAAAAMLLGLLLIGALPPICSATPRLRPCTHTRTSHARTNVDPHRLARIARCARYSQAHPLLTNVLDLSQHIRGIVRLVGLSLRPCFRAGREVPADAASAVVP